MSGNGGTSSAITNRGVVIVGLVGLVSGVLLLWWDTQWDNPTASAVISNVGGLVLATTLVTVAWELAGKRSFSDEILAKARLSTDVSRAGLQRVTDLYLEEVEWRDLIDNATKIDIVVAYANTWRNAHYQSLAKVAKKSGSRIRVFLPDPDDAFTMRVLSDRFDMSPEALAGKVREAVEGFGRLRSPEGADVQIYTAAGDRVFSCYRFDGRAVITLYSHKRERQSSVPTLVVGQGVLWDFVYQETRAIREQSKLVTHEEES